SNLLSGAYPPNQKDWQWGNKSDASLGLVWQPFPIETYMPKDQDLVLNSGKDCKIVDQELDKIFNRSDVKEFVKRNQELYKNMSHIVGKTIDFIDKASGVHGVLDIEMSYNHYWTHVWTKAQEEQIVKQLYESHIEAYRLRGDSPIIQRLRAGGLVKEINKNFERVLNNTNTKKESQ
ncbi:unnamed protein product, partial [Oppiella nova]